jgi:hypothetical protein
MSSIVVPLWMDQGRVKDPAAGSSCQQTGLQAGQKEHGGFFGNASKNT